MVMRMHDEKFNQTRHKKPTRRQEKFFLPYRRGFTMDIYVPLEKKMSMLKLTRDKGVHDTHFVT